MILPQEFYFNDTTSVAKSLLGKVLHIQTTGQEFRARIVETEAYLGVIDPACHTFGNKKTPRTKSMYMDGGHSYVYMIYGMYFCLNFVTRTSEHPEAVLIRGLEPLPSDPDIKKKNIKTNGPGKLCKHYHITKALDGVCLWKKKSPLFVSDDNFKVSAKNIIARPRIGVDYAGEAAAWPLRFYIADNVYVSKK
ncbi:DNA-3-methyladenine glycosylase [Bdellovibrio svalbardensis]|uniref:Putative 3-methyladenine DNA glycosylase n=1 Tax=Bdellovibrio svalbardensis TaxID=2972972 RepID=A0ABT6DDW7_9BACT|nr:DNA-3-methyladenine glycosylase [Bdellovibrio svalbardensis]MDG0815035.1 DNA-3-methyladenine glycosylase [Bdellovibrio svalbardensis]